MRSHDKPGDTAAYDDELVSSLRITRNDEPVRVWIAALACSAYGRLSRRSRDILRPSEHVRWDQLPAERRRISFFLGRYAAKRAAAAYLGVASLLDLELVTGVFDQPILRFAAHDLPHVTLCHTSNLVLAVAHQSDHILGIDAEPIEESRCDVLRPHMTTAECELLQTFDLKEAQRLFLLWTAKEALSKALRCGLTLSLPLLEISSCDVAGHEAYRCAFANFGQYQARCWLTHGMALAMALPRRSVLHDSLSELLNGLAV